MIKKSKIKISVVLSVIFLLCVFIPINQVLGEDSVTLPATSTNTTSSTTDTDTSYSLLAPISGTELDGSEPIETDPQCDRDSNGNIIEGTCKNPCPFGNYLNIIIKIVIGFSAVLAMVMIVMGGVEYMTSELISSKEEGKERIQHAILGLIIALGAYTILNTINPKLLSACLDNLPQAKVTISPEDTSTGSSTSLCISTTNPPDPEQATGTTLALNQYMKNEYIPARDSLGLKSGIKLLATAQATFEGFYKGSKSYNTKNPGNIGNTDTGATVSYSKLTDGIKKQSDVITNVALGNSTSYKIGSTPTCALGNEKYSGYLYQYLRIYATGARVNNSYLNAIIGYFKSNGKNITPKTTIKEIYNMN